MEESRQSSPKLGYPRNNDDVKYVSGLSAILVATIQEAKDRISQIEYVFCSQLYQHFQSKSKSLQQIYSEAKREAECAWKEKQKDLQLLIEQLRLEKKEALDENRSLRLQKEKLLGESDEKTNSLVTKVTSQQIRIDQLEHELMQKSKEVDEGMELHNKLLQLVQAKTTMIADQGKQVKEHEEKTSGLLAEVKRLEKKVKELQEELRRKNVEKKELADDYLHKIEQQLTEREKEKEKLTRDLLCMKYNVEGLDKELKEKMKEIEEGRALQAQLLQQIDTNAAEILKQKQQLQEYKNEKKQLMHKVNALEDKVWELNSSSMVAGEQNTYGNVLQQIESKSSELLAEKKKRKDLFDAYKRLKSQYNFLCSKFGLTTENMVPQNKLEDGSGPLKQQQNLANSTEFENKSLDNSTAACAMNKVKIEDDSSDGLEDDKAAKSIPNSSFYSPTSSHMVQKCASMAKSSPVTGAKRPASCWIGTRSRQCKDGLDPHDDFLDTPLENLKGNLKKAMKEIDECHVPVQEDKSPCSSDDETQDLLADPSPEKQKMPVSVGGKRYFKYVEPVRKKAERENLKGVECKQCKKFYDAVLPNNGGKDADGNNRNFRCEHHDGVSRHRYKYIPPMTPEGFWNIGFESEM